MQEVDHEMSKSVRAVLFLSIRVGFWITLCVYAIGLLSDVLSYGFAWRLYNAFSERAIIVMVVMWAGLSFVLFCYYGRLRGLFKI